jgi:hypothetical protein
VIVTEAVALTLRGIPRRETTVRDCYKSTLTVRLNEIAVVYSPLDEHRHDHVDEFVNRTNGLEHALR